MEIRLTDREADVMEVLWQRGPSTVAEVRDRLADELAYTTVLTVLRTLEEKGYVAHEQEGRAHRYLAVVERELARRSALQAVVRKFFEGSQTLLLAHLVDDEKLSEQDIVRIRSTLRRRAKAKGGKPR
jgi:BlaI family transcriptional regulator, penicillinase repressor